MDRPILFSPTMVRAILDGRKTQTRRILSRHNVTVLGDRWGRSSPWSGLRFDEATVRERSPISGARDVHLAVPFWHPEDGPAPTEDCGIYRVRPEIEIGDRLWVREAWRAEARYDDLSPRDIPEGAPIYYQTEPEPGCAGRYRHGRFMCRWASRLTLIVTDARVQRLQEISEEDALAEGCYRQDDANPCAKPGIKGFYYTWQEINAKRGYGWQANPWVIALTFTAHRCNIDQMAEAA